MELQVLFKPAESTIAADRLINNARLEIINKNILKTNFLEWQ